MSETDSGRLPRIYWGTAIALGAFAAAKLIPLPDVASSTGEVLSLTSTGRSALGIVFFTVILWALEVFPFPITALVGAVMLPLFGVMEWRDVIRFGVGSRHLRCSRFLVHASCTIWQEQLPLWQ
jgi:di/tricarboxylate transporter